MQVLTDRELGQLVRLSAKKFKERESYPFIDGYHDGYVVSDFDYMRANSYETGKLLILVEIIRE
jgi:hypothetical protein